MKNAKQLLITSVFLGSLTLSSVSHASVLIIDEFSDIQSVIDTGITEDSTSNTLSNVNGTGLTNLSRIFVAKASNPRPAIESIKASGNSLVISNNPMSTGVASVQWDFDPIDFTTYTNEIRLEVLYIDKHPNISVSVEMLVNGVSSSEVKTFSTTGKLLFSFNDFSDPAVFNEVNSLRLNFSGTRAWDASFRLSALEAPQGGLTTVPLPTSFVLMGSVLLGFIGISRKSTPRS